MFFRMFPRALCIIGVSVTTFVLTHTNVFLILTNRNLHNKQCNCKRWTIFWSLILNLNLRWIWKKWFHLSLNPELLQPMCKIYKKKKSYRSMHLFLHLTSVPSVCLSTCALFFFSNTPDSKYRKCVIIIWTCIRFL